MLAIERLEDGWHAFYLRKGRAGRSLLRPALALPALPLPALRFALARALSLAGKPWRRTAALLRARSG